MSMRAHSTAVQDSLNDYTFGTANDRKIPGHKLNDSQVGQPTHDPPLWVKQRTHTARECSQYALPKTPKKYYQPQYLYGQ